jgi:hypothetical protein
MADPASVLSIVNGSIGLVLKIGSAVNKLYTLSQRLKYAELTLQALASECETVQTAWIGIEAWAQKQPVVSNAGYAQQVLLDRLERSLMFGAVVLTALEEDLEPLTVGPRNLGFFKKSKVVWNEAVFEGHQNRLRGQISAMTLLLQVTNLYVDLLKIEFLEERLI